MFPPQTQAYSEVWASALSGMTVGQVRCTHLAIFRLDEGKTVVMLCEISAPNAISHRNRRVLKALGYKVKTAYLASAEVMDILDRLEREQAEARAATIRQANNPSAN